MWLWIMSEACPLCFVLIKPAACLRSFWQKSSSFQPFRKHCKACVFQPSVLSTAQLVLWLRTMFGLIYVVHFENIFNFFYLMWQKLLWIHVFPWSFIYLLTPDPCFPTRSLEHRLKTRGLASIPCLTINQVGHFMSLLEHSQFYRELTVFLSLRSRISFI